ncbi:hypothetical protein [Methylobacterium sp. J-092]|nr:hypothetical protein [Methylobacterium sp. J-092]MCJ2007558.1 hypothetical protein [Methylobacterium sp. J-092]
MLLAALLHAGWNTLLRGGADRLWTMSVMNLAVGGLGLAPVGGGLPSLSLGRAGLSRGTLLAALGTAATIAAYTLIDGIGVRLSGDWVGDTAAMVTVHRASPLWLLLTRGSAALGGRPAAVARAVGGGAASLLAYAAVIWAMRLGAMGPVSALRETSVVFAALLGRAFLAERLTAGRIAACTVVAAGAAMIGHG